MTRLVHVLALLLVAALALGAVAPVLATDEDWLLGRWELIRSPDGDKKDWLEFAPDGRMTTITPDGRRMPGRYVDRRHPDHAHLRARQGAALRPLRPDRQDRGLREADAALTGGLQARRIRKLKRRSSSC
jgi:hypothetical protein